MKLVVSVKLGFAGETGDFIPSLWRQVKDSVVIALFFQFDDSVILGGFGSVDEGKLFINILLVVVVGIVFVVIGPEMMLVIFVVFITRFVLVVMFSEVGRLSLCYPYSLGILFASDR